MCGIVGYIGKRQASDLLVEGLSKLEYRGYDSAGVAIIENEKISVRKLKGRLANLKNDLSANFNQWTYRNMAYKMGNSWRTIRC